MSQALLILDAVSSSFSNGMRSAVSMICAAAEVQGSQFDILVVAARNGNPFAEQVARFGAQRVLLLESEAFDINVPETLVDGVLAVAAEYALIVAPADRLGVELLPRLASLLDAGYVADCTGIRPHDGRIAFCHTLHAGNVTAWLCLDSPVAMATVRSSHFPPAVEIAQPSPIERLEVKWRPESPASAIEVTEVAMSNQDVSRLAEAQLIVAGGVRFKSAFFQVLQPLASALGAEIGATRSACVAGFAPFERQVGQTGKVVAPKLYLAIGISGSVQHMAGIKGARTIVAINKDRDAPIFRWADYGLVGDMFEIVPALVACLKAKDVVDVAAPSDQQWPRRAVPPAFKIEQD